MQLFRASTSPRASAPVPGPSSAPCLPEATAHTETSVAADLCAALLLDTMPRVLKAVRAAVTQETRPGTGKSSRPTPRLNVPQFRALIFVDQHAGASLSAAAEFLGLSLPSASKLVDGLVRRGLLARHNDRNDRRRMTLRLSRKGDALLADTLESVRRHFAGLLGRVDAGSLGVLSEALGVLQKSFPPLGTQEAVAGSPAGQGVGTGHKCQTARRMPDHEDQRNV